MPLFKLSPKTNHKKYFVIQVTEGVKSLKSRNLRCAAATNENLSMAAGRMYAEKIFGPKEREHVNIVYLHAFGCIHHSTLEYARCTKYNKAWHEFNDIMIRLKSQTES